MEEMSLEDLPDELICIIFKQLLDIQDSNSFRDLASTSHRLNWLSRKIIPPKQWQTNVKCTKYRRCGSKRYWELREQFHLFLKNEQTFPNITSEDLQNFGHFLPFFWIKLMQLKYFRVHGIVFAHCNLNDTRPFQYIYNSIRDETSLARTNYDLVTDVELFNVHKVTLCWVDQMLFLFRRLKNLKIETLELADGTISDDSVKEIIRARASSPIKLDCLSLTVTRIAINFMQYLAQVCPAKTYVVHRCNSEKTYQTLKIYLLFNGANIKKFISFGAVIFRLEHDNLLDNIDIECIGPRIL